MNASTKYLYLKYVKKHTMGSKLLDLTTQELLGKFGIGSHKPGSGSAAAFQGMLSTKLLITVINLTSERNKSGAYTDRLKELFEMRSRIEDRIFPELSSLFHEDSIQFDKAIKSREARDREKDPIQKNLLARQALEELKPAILIPMKIAELSIELAEIATFVFDNGFQSARGDSHVALSGAVAAVGGCLAIIQLNLLSFKSDELTWSEDIRIRSAELKVKFEQLNEIAASKIRILETEAQRNSAMFKDINIVLKNAKSSRRKSDAEIEKYAIQLQLLAWKHRGTIWKKNTPNDPLEILSVETLFKKVLGYDFFRTKELGLKFGDNGITEIAGVLDQQKRMVQISSDFPSQTIAFTAAHELGHAILHTQAVLHRDIPFDGTGGGVLRTLEERQADKFASYFLMPRKQVIKVFHEYFSTIKFIIDQDTAFQLINDNPSRLRAISKDLRGLSRILASAESYGSKSFQSIANVFKVSPEAMAIRLEELKLVEF